MVDKAVIKPNVEGYAIELYKDDELVLSMYGLDNVNVFYNDLLPTVSINLALKEVVVQK